MRPPLLRGPELMLFDHETGLIDRIHDPLTTSFNVTNAPCIEQESRYQCIKTLCYTVVYTTVSVRKK